jgi:hypothetical protein
MTRTSDGSSSDETERFARYRDELVDAVDASVRPWIERSIREVAERQGGPGAVTDRLLTDAADAADATHDEVVPALRALMRVDAEAQRANPLQLLRDGVRHATAVLAAHGVPPVRRDQLQQETLPLDVYDIAPATWADIGADLVEPGITWSAAKAHVVLTRRRRSP